jgi:hemerythrin-like metal-binding protein
MAALGWVSAYQLGVPGIDEQHRRLFGLFDALHAAMRAGKGKDILARTFASLDDYTREHFAAEEKLLRQCAYPDFPAHKKTHEELLHRLKALRETFAQGEPVTTDVLKFLSTWLVQHIGETDRRYVPFLSGA